MTLEEKMNSIKKSGFCFICLKKGHLANKCKTFTKCLSCHKRHNVILCPNVHKTESTLFTKHNETFLQTLIVTVSYNGRNMKVRALLDSGSQRSYVKSSVAKELKLEKVGTENIKHTLFGGTTGPARVYNQRKLNVSNIDNSFSFQMLVLEQPNLCGSLPSIKDDATLLQELKSHNIQINDKNIEIGLLIGSDYFGSIMTNNLFSINKSLLAVETKLGWTIQGPTQMNDSTVNNVSVSYVSQSDICNLWNIELLGIRDPYEKQEKEVIKAEILKCFNNNISVNEDGRYEVSLLWKEGCPEPDANYDVAQKRLQSTTRKLIKTGNLQSYSDVFKTWQREGIIEEVIVDNKNEGHYIPHHTVIKPSSTTTMLRPVFDASAKDCKGLSLNDCIDKGINLIELIPKLLILFRRGAYGAIADIAKAFLQISVSKNDRKYLKFLWWKDFEMQQEVVTYQHNRVMFGVNCSPFLLAATINFHLDNCGNKYRETVQKLKESFYVDNCTASFDTITQRDNFISQSREIMAMAKFDLRGWVTAPERMEGAVKDTHVLGLTWNTEEDTLCCNINSNENYKGKITKRYLLSVTQQIFDPLGIVCPATVVPKRLLQKVWKRKFDWDEEICPELAREFKIWQSTIHLLKKCKIPRRLTAAPIKKCNNSIHTFSDASEDAYAACVYLRTEQEGKVHVQLIIAKSRIAPANKKMSLPRLELMGAVIASRLYREVIDSGLMTPETNYNSYFWTDSTVVLAWVKQQRQWKPFVSNRVKEISRNSDIDSWNHISGDCNPADLPSRGCNANALLEKRWWEGPTWLRNRQDCWPISSSIQAKPNEEIVRKEEKSQSHVNMSVTEPLFSKRLLYFSKYNKIIRLVAWLLRWNPKVRRQFAVASDLSNDECVYAEKTLFKLLQKEDFAGGHLPNNFKTRQSSDGVLRVKTRLELSHEHKDFVNPILLSGKNEIVRRFVRQRHEILQHAGTQTLMSSIRNEFWVLGIRRLAKRVVSECVICKKYKCKHYEVPEAPLPTDRVESVTAFQTTGIDFAGPLVLRNQTKCWIALFTCATYRAVHLELVESLSTNSFIMALRRFIARRGRIQVIYTDNGTNFQGTANLLNNVDWKEVEVTTAVLPQPIKWKFIPPASPWWGGWWERLVRVMKEMLRRILGKASLSWIELTTLLCEWTIHGRDT
ncbi:uncharacterized protein LOC126371185 isoform X4 [Pectinophora gossypiella]|uniref:uncharacterized protein LOC126371185 isoform X4 n=1 Tax=Pectinophora gossypiella TaxID=13191 RepID=UPI00214F04EF|nr:uncharacterized protein LOC126371185 isoform X4 [Pectinophora gossypiella]